MPNRSSNGDVHFTWKQVTKSSRSMLAMNKGKREMPLNNKAKKNKLSKDEQIAAIKKELAKLGA